jgi:hypothetical protein
MSSSYNFDYWGSTGPVKYTFTYETDLIENVKNKLAQSIEDQKEVLEKKPTKLLRININGNYT